jgi:protoporphyrinogen oxidase
MSSAPITILGAGLAGLSASYHFGHERCIVFEQHATAGGHTRSEQLFGFTFDQGPHVSFTKHAYVRELFERSTKRQYREFEVRTRNYFRGHWIDHPAQVHLWQIPEPLRSACYQELLAAEEAGQALPVTNYQQWLEASFGPTFTNTFPAAYTRKYWTMPPASLSADWLGPRVHRPQREQIDVGMKPGARQSLHYINRVRYPERGGYQSFLAELSRGANVRIGRQVASIDLSNRRLWFADGDMHAYERLISTLPLNSFIACCQHVPAAVRDASAALDCSKLLLVNACAPHPARVDGHWFYVYDEDKHATRISLSDRLSPGNAPAGHSAVQVEVYFGRERPLENNPQTIAQAVANELAEMGFVDESALGDGRVNFFWRWIPQANIIFSHARREALQTIFAWLEQFGLAREEDDLMPSSDWTAEARPSHGEARLMLAGRFAQWKYFWTDDCILRGRQLAGADS